MGQLLSVLMVLGGDTSEKQGDLDATLPLEVGGGELRTNTDRVRYHSPNKDVDDVELEDDERTAQYFNTSRCLAEGIQLIHRELADPTWPS